MVAIATSIQPIVCQTALEAQVRELRLIAEHKPRFNRRSTRPERAVWVKLTVEPYPRLSIVRDVRDDQASGARYAGPFGSRAAAEAAVAAVHDVLPLRQCTTRLSTKGAGSACVLAEMGRCGAPCEGRQTQAEYAVHVQTAAALLIGDGRALVDALCERMRALARQERFEDAGALRDRLGHLVRGAARAQRLAPLAAPAPRSSPPGAPTPAGGSWSASATAGWPGPAWPPAAPTRWSMSRVCGRPPRRCRRPAGPAPAAYPEETELVLRWLESPGVRIVDLDGEWTCPVGGAGAAKATLGAVAARRLTDGGPTARRTLAVAATIADAFGLDRG